MSILTSLNREDFIDILSRYNLGSYRSNKHIYWALANTIYVVRTSKRKIIIKVYEQCDMRFIRYQLMLSSYCASKGLPVPKTFHTKNNEEILQWKNKRLAIQEFVYGIHPKKFNDALILDIARKQALMNKVLLKLPTTHEFTWGVDFDFKEKIPVDVPGISFKAETSKLLREMKSVNRKSLRLSNIHSDIHGVNILVMDNKLKSILDWDDAHEDYFIRDVAIFIANSLIQHKSTYKRKIRLYLHEYQSILPLRSEEKKMLYFLIKARLLGGISWNTRQIPRHKDIKRKIVGRVNELISTYNIIKDLSLKDFLELF